MMDANGSHLKPLAAARLMFTPSRELIFTGVTSAGTTLIRTVERSKTAVSAAGLGPRGIVQGGSPRMPSADASNTSLNSNHMSSAGATGATNLLIKIVAIALTAVSAAGLGLRLTVTSGNLRMLAADARMWWATTRTTSLTGVTSAIDTLTRTAVTKRTQIVVSAVGRGPSGTVQSGSPRRLAADVSTKLAI